MSDMLGPEDNALLIKEQPTELDDLPTWGRGLLTSPTDVSFPGSTVGALPLSPESVPASTHQCPHSRQRKSWHRQAGLGDSMTGMTDDQSAIFQGASPQEPRAGLPATSGRMYIQDLAIAAMQEIDPHLIDPSLAASTDRIESNTEVVSREPGVSRSESTEGRELLKYLQACPRDGTGIQVVLTIVPHQGSTRSCGYIVGTNDKTVLEAISRAAGNLDSAAQWTLGSPQTSSRQEVSDSTSRLLRKIADCATDLDGGGVAIAASLISAELLSELQGSLKLLHDQLRQGNGIDPFIALPLYSFDSVPTDHTEGVAFSDDPSARRKTSCNRVSLASTRVA